MSDVPQKRGSGRTTEQMKAAPNGAIFVWCSDATKWAKDKARELGRADLIVIGPRDLWYPYVDRLRGREYPAIVFDHAIRDVGLDPEQWEGYQRLLNMVRHDA